MYAEEYSIAVANHHYNDEFAHVGSEGRIGVLGINLYPTLLPDGLPEPTWPYTHAILEATIIERMAAVAPCTIDFTGSITGNELILDISIEKDEGEDMPNPRVHVVITETNIPYTGPNYETMNFVDRNMVPSHMGTDITMQGNSHTMQITTTLDESWDQENIILIVWVEDGSNHHVFQTYRVNLPDLVPSVESPGTIVTPMKTTISNFPNPFNPSTTIDFSIEEAGAVDVTIFDIKGRKVLTLVNEHLTEGTFTTTWDGRDSHGNPQASGVYFMRLKTSSSNVSSKIMLLK